MKALKPRPPFQVLIMSEESRLGREAIETAYALKQLITAGVRVFFYLEDRERTLDSPIEKVMLSLQTMADEMEREKARQRATTRMGRKARAGPRHRRPVLRLRQRADRRRERRTLARRAAHQRARGRRRAADLRARGDGYGQRIAKLLNAEGTPAPRAQQGRPRAWVPTSVHEVLFRPLYRGEMVWNQTRKRDRWGQQRTSDRPEGEWICIGPALAHRAG